MFPSNGSNHWRYLGILANDFYDTNEKQKIVWVANIANPLRDTYGVLKITQEGKLMTNDRSGISTILNTKQNSPISNISNRSATLDDSGNFLPNMKLGLFDLKSGNPQHKFLTSWLSPKVADLEAFMLGVNPNNTKQLMSWKRGIVYWSSEIFNGKNFNCSAYVERCVKPKLPNCIGGDVFKETRKSMNPYLHLPNSNLGLSDCKEICMRNRSCEAYGSSYADGSGCIFDAGSNILGDEDVLYIRISRGGSNKVGKGMKLLMEELNNSAATIDELSNERKLELKGKKYHELPFVRFSSIEIATGYFTEKNKIGHGGYGPFIR
ncbi:unnamed protein product [Camellia sinensis]